MRRQLPSKRQALAKRISQLPVSVQALLIQLAVLPVTVLLVVLTPLREAGVLSVALLQGILAAGLSARFRLPVWWLGIQVCFWPLLLIASASHGLQFASPFILLALVLLFGNLVRDRVPLFLSSVAVQDALAAWLLSLRPEPKRLIDIGCGTGGLIAGLQHRVPSAQIDGVESAMLPWLIARLRQIWCRSGCGVTLGSLWQVNLGRYDVVYAYLSPEPMARLWDKACQEMRPGSYLVSNSFPVPGVAPERQETVSDWNDSTLYFWRIPDGSHAK